MNPGLYIYMVRLEQFIITLPQAKRYSEAPTVLV